MEKKYILTMLILLGSMGTLLFAQSNENILAEELEWHAYTAVGDYRYSNPPKPNDFFIIQYRTINGTTNAFYVQDRSFIAKVNGEKNNLFEIKIPRNYPYTNIGGEGREDAFSISSNGTFLNSGYEVKKTECFFSYSIPFSGNQTIQLDYAYYTAGIPFYGDDVPSSCIKETVFHGSTIEDNLPLVPLKQSKHGVKPDLVNCKPNLILAIKNTDGSPSCVKPETKQKLIERGWARHV